MPTARPRHQITETDDVARALDLAARRWPGEPRGRLAVRLIMAAGEHLADESATRRRHRRQSLVRMGTTYGSLYPEGYLDEVRHDWPE